MSDHPDQLLLAEFHVGDLPAEQAATVTAHVSGCPRCRARVEAMARDVETYAKNLPAREAVLRARIAATQPVAERPRRAPLWGWGLAAGGLAAAMIAVVSFRIAVHPGSSPSTLDGTRLKDVAAMQVVVRRGAEQSFVRQGDVLQVGDALRFVLVTDRPGYLTVLSIDSRRQLTALYPRASPEQHPDAMHIPSPGRHELPDSIVLDASPGPERLVWVFAAKPFARDVVHRSIQSLLSRKGPMALTTNALDLAGRVGVLSIDKVPRPGEETR